MTANIHIDGNAQAKASIEAMCTAIVQVMAGAHEYRADSASLNIALGLLNRAGGMGPTSISNCQFTNAPSEAACKIAVDREPDEDDADKDEG